MKKLKRTKSLLAILLTLCICATLPIATVFAEDENLKINIDVINTYDEENENVIRPLYECKLNGKIKETKDEIKGTLGDNYILKRDEESGELYIKEINEQLSFNDMEGEDEDDRF